MKQYTIEELELLIEQAADQGDEATVEWAVAEIKKLKAK